MLRISKRTFADVKKMIENEFYTNPHFPKAFPHLYQKVGQMPDPEITTSWGDSLSYKRKEQPQPKHFIDHEHDKMFVEGYRSPKGPIKWASEEEKDLVHAQIDFKMDELEQSGLSRDEILLNKPGGLPLSMDPVFQFLRHNRAAREMLVKPGEEFLAYKVIDYALRQDIGVDKAKTLPNTNPQFEHELPQDYDYSVLHGEAFPNKVKPEDYYWEEKLKEKKQTIKDYAGGTPLVFPNKILSKGKRYKANRREINIKDINFKNTEFLAQFMTEGAKMKNRWQTRLQQRIQKKVAKAIKHAKNLNLFPTRSFILPPHKMNLVPINAQTFQNSVIHAETGTVFAKKYEGEVSRMNDKEYHNTIEKIAEQFVLSHHNENFEENMLKAQGLIDYDLQFMPSKKQLEILEAHRYMLKGNGEGKETAEKLLEVSQFQYAADLGLNYIQEKAVDPSIVLYI